MERALTKEVWSPFRNITTHKNMGMFLRKPRIISRRTLNWYRNNEEVGPISNPPAGISNAVIRCPRKVSCLRSADPALSGNRLKASLPTTGFVPNNRGRQLRSASAPIVKGVIEDNSCSVKDRVSKDSRHFAFEVAPLGALVSCRLLGPVGIIGIKANIRPRLVRHFALPSI